MSVKSRDEMTVEELAARDLETMSQTGALEKIKRLAKNFIIDAGGSWETGEGNYCLALIDEYDKKYGGKNVS